MFYFGAFFVLFPETAEYDMAEFFLYLMWCVCFSVSAHLQVPVKIFGNF
jgi:hypothetical protein